MGRQAPGREHADRRPRQRLSHQRRGADRARHGCALSDCDGGVRRDEEPGRVVLAPGNRERARGTRAAVQAEDGPADREGAGEGSHQGQHGRVFEADPVGQRRGADRRSVAADRADRAARGGPRARRDVRGASPAAAPLPGYARVRPADAARAVQADRFRAQGSRCRECRHPRVDRAAARPGRRGPPVPADEGGRGVGTGGDPRPQRVL